MSLAAAVKDGIIQETKTTVKSSVKQVSGGALDKEAFLQLLVAQMKYQDPLEPTSNTEYIAQLATFSELEEMQNLSSSMSVQQASGLVGENVIVRSVSDTTGETSYVSGKVDFTVIENGKAYLSIGGSLYAIENLDTVIDEEYLDGLEAEV